VSSFLRTEHQNVTDEETDRQPVAAVCIASNADALQKLILK